MPYVFINSGNPEASDYDSSYLYYDDTDIKQMRHVLEIMDQREYANQSHRRYITKMIERALEKKSQPLIEQRRRRPQAMLDLKQIVSDLFNRIVL